MFRTVLSAAVSGMEATIVRVEVDISNGLPSFQMVGYLSSEVKEAGERVRTAIHNAGDRIPAKRIIINLSPADVRKRGTAYDLPIAAAVLMGLYESREELFKDTLILGELSLDGSVKKVSGVLPVVLEAKSQGYHTCMIPMANAEEGTCVKGVDIIGVSHISEIIEYIKGATPSAYNKNTMNVSEKTESYEVDFADIHGQELVKRAAEIAVAGGHNFLMIGPPGAGKSMIAKRIPTILPPMTIDESMEISKVYSVLGLLDENNPIVWNRPFREVHHTITKTALIGGGNPPRPGELSMATGGVLFLDELTEFPKQVLEVLRQPLEEKSIRVSRSSGTYTFPANTILIGAMNPCPCGNYPDLNRCSCTEHQIARYLGKVSQPFLDRMDICIETPRVEYEDLTKGEKGMSSQVIRERVCRARLIQEKRFAGSMIYVNAEIPANQLEQYCKLDLAGEQLMKLAFEQMNLTARTYHKILRVARTIADLDAQETVNVSHMREAIGYRTMDKKYWER